MTISINPFDVVKKFFLVNPNEAGNTLVCVH